MNEWKRLGPNFRNTKSHLVTTKSSALFHTKTNKNLLPQHQTGCPLSPYKHNHWASLQDNTEGHMPKIPAYYNMNDSCRVCIPHSLYMWQVGVFKELDGSRRARHGPGRHGEGKHHILAHTLRRAAGITVCCSCWYTTRKMLLLQIKQDTDRPPFFYCCFFLLKGEKVDWW